MIDKVIEKFEFTVTLVLLLLIALIVVGSVVELARIMFLEFVDGPVHVFELQDIIGFLGFFLVVLITLELMRSVWL